MVKETYRVVNSEYWYKRFICNLEVGSFISLYVQVEARLECQTDSFSLQFLITENDLKISKLLLQNLKNIFTIIRLNKIIERHELSRTVFGNCSITVS